MKIEIYGASWCSSCKSVKDFCKSQSIDYDYIDIDDTVNMRNLEKRTGFKIRTVPQIFKDGVHVAGGFAELKQQLLNI